LVAGLRITRKIGFDQKLWTCQISDLYLKFAEPVPHYDFERDVVAFIEEANKATDRCAEHAAEQNSVLTKIQPLCTREKLAEYREMIGKSMGAMLFEVINPIVAKYPELKPPQLK